MEAEEPGGDDCGTRENGGKTKESFGEEKMKSDETFVSGGIVLANNFRCFCELALG